MELGWQEQVGDLEYRSPITDEETEQVILHLRDNFFPDEPLNKSLLLCEVGKPHDLLEQHSIKTISDSLSVLAVSTETNEVAGVLLSGILRPGEFEKDLKGLGEVPDKSYRTIFDFIYRKNLEVDLFQKYNVDQIFESRILSVDKKFRGKGIASKLFKITEQIAMRNNFKVLKADCTGLFSQKIVKDLCFEPVLEVQYSDYLDENGEQVFKTEGPHKSFQICIKEITDNHKSG